MGLDAATPLIFGKSTSQIPSTQFMFFLFPQSLETLGLCKQNSKQADCPGLPLRFVGPVLVEDREGRPAGVTLQVESLVQGGREKLRVVDQAAAILTASTRLPTRGPKQQTNNMTPTSQVLWVNKGFPVLDGSCMP